MQSVESVLAFLKALARACLRHSVAVGLSVIVCVGGATAIVLSRPPVYTASMTLESADEQINETGPAPARLGFGVMAGPLPTYFKLMESREVAQLLIDNEHFDRALFWGAVDPTTGAWKAQRTGFGPALDRLFGIAHSPRPTAEDVQRAVSSMLTIDRDILADLATVSCTSPSRTLCAALLAAAHRQTEFRLRQITRLQALKRHDYAIATLAKTTDPGIRKALTAALERADAQIVASDLGEPMGASVIEPPLVPSEPVYPRPRLILLVSVLLGLALGMAIAWMLEARRGMAR
jgi:uncharacterized protein involved in exopolysaccharide biosynthesis